MQVSTLCAFDRFVLSAKCTLIIRLGTGVSTTANHSCGEGVAVWARGAEATPTAQDWACAITGLLPDRSIVAQVKRSTSIAFAANRSNAHITSHHSVWDSAGPAWPDCYRSAQLRHQWTTNMEQSDSRS